MKRIARYRLGQIIATLMQLSYFPALWTGLIYQGQSKSLCVPILTCWSCPLARFSCPMGSLQYFIGSRKFPFYIIGFLGLVGIIVGRMSCAWICPFGFFQDLLKKLTKIKLTIPQNVTYIKYLVLIIIAGVLVFITTELWFCKLCPAGTLEAGLPLIILDRSGDLKALVGSLFIIKVTILAIIILGSIFIKRFFCRIFCPIGAIYSIFNRISIIRLKVTSGKCLGKNCNRCQKVCPMDIKVYEDPNQKECIRCLECKYKCPKIAISVPFLSSRS
jgi:polyferredoxin